MIHLGQRGRNVFIVVLVFLTVFFHCEWSPVLHNFELIGVWKVFQNTLSRLTFERIDFLGFLNHQFHKCSYGMIFASLTICLFEFTRHSCMNSMWRLLSTSWNGWVILLNCMFLFYKQIEIPRLGLRQLKCRFKIC